MTKYLDVYSDSYLKDPDRYDALATALGTSVCMVDLNSAYVPPKQNKYASDEDTRARTENNIRQRFALETPDTSDDGDD